MKRDASQSAQRRPDLILTADTFLDHMLLDANGFARQLVWRRHPAAQSIESVEQPDGERGRRAEAGACRQIAHVLDLYSIRAFTGELHESCADRGVHQLPMIAHELDLRIDDAMFVRKEGRKLAHEDIAVLVDGCSEHGTSVLLVPRGVVGAAAQK